MYPDLSEFTSDIAAPLGGYYAVAAAMNALAAWRAFRGQGMGRMRAGAWLTLALLFAVFGALAWSGRPPELPQSVKLAIDAALGPVTFFFGSLTGLIVLFVGRRFFVRKWVAWTILNVALAFLGLSLTDRNFAQIVLKADNVPIVAMVFLLGFFTWLGAAQAVENDQRLQRGQAPEEKDYAEKTLVWPDLVYIELICMVAISAVLIVWSLVLRAPLEQPANPVVTPNPSKAPWYFLGLQEMLVFFDPSIAGVILPGLIILGLAAIPFLDFSPKGSGYYSIAPRRRAYVVFMFGFLQLWILLILVGTFMRGPNWNFFGLYEPRDPHKVLALNNVKLSEYLWVMGLGRDMPQPPPDSGGLARLAWSFWREIAGVALLGAYFVGIPVVLARTSLKRLAGAMGKARYTLMILLLLIMFALPLKMLLRWTCNLSYVVSMPEYYFNF
jgi:uncharacterized membrane protein